MATVIWKGGASTVAQVQTDEFTGTTWTGGATLTATFTDEGGSTQTVTLATTNVTEEVQRDLFLTVLQNDIQTLPLAITFTSSSTDTIVSTAKIAGVPFYLVISENDAAGGITEVNDGTGSSARSEGPEDFKVDGSSGYTGSNWVTTEDAVSVRPSANDVVKFNQGSHSCRYGLVTGINTNEIRLTPEWTGTYGDPANGYYLDMDATNGGDKVMVIEKIEGDVWATVECDNVFVKATARGANAVRFGAGSNIADDGGTAGLGGIVCVGPRVRGTVQILSGATLHNFRVGNDTFGRYIIGAVVLPFSFECGSGIMDLNLGTVGMNAASPSATEPGRVLVYGSGVVRHFGTQAGDTIALWLQLGGRGEPNGPCAITLLDVRGGLVTFENNRSEVTVATTELYGGHIEEGGQGSVTFDVFNQHGGSSNVSATINDHQQQAI